MADVQPIAAELIVPPLPRPKATTLLDGVYLGEITDDENLRLTSFNSLTGVTIRIVGRIKRPDQTIADLDYTQVPNTDRSAKATDFPLGAGYLLNLSVYASAGSPKVGQTFANVRIVRGRTGATLPGGTLAQGYLTGSQDRAWPGSPIDSSLDTQGVVRVVNGTDPAPGVQIRETVPAGARWLFLAIRAQFVASAAAGTRRFHVEFGDGTQTVFAAPIPGTAGPTDSKSINLVSGLALEVASATSTFVGGMPIDIQLGAGATIQTATPGGDVGDDWQAPMMTVREWLEAQ